MLIYSTRLPVGTARVLLSNCAPKWSIAQRFRFAAPRSNRSPPPFHLLPLGGAGQRAANGSSRAETVFQVELPLGSNVAPVPSGQLSLRLTTNCVGSIAGEVRRDRPGWQQIGQPPSPAELEPLSQAGVVALHLVSAA